MIITAEPGTEGYVRWARAKLEELGRLRRDLNLPKMTKLYAPDESTLVHIVASEWQDSIRITGGASVRYLGLNTSVQARLDKAVQYENNESIDWSNDFKTYARWDTTPVTGGVHIKRAHVDLKVTDSYAFPDDASTTFFRRNSAVLSANGKFAVIALLGGMADQNRIAQIARWNSDTNVFDVAPLPLPPGLLTQMAAWVGLHVDVGSSGTHTGLILGSVSVPFGTVGSRLQPCSATWVLRASPLGKKVHLHVKRAEPTSWFVFGVSSAPASYWVVTWTEFDQVWEYDIATATWSLLQEEPHTTFSDLMEDAPSLSGLFRLNREPSVKPHTTMAYDEKGDVRKFQYDNVTGVTYAVFSDPNISGAVIYRATAPRALSADVKLDGVAWFPAVSVSNSDVDYDAFTDISVLQVNAARLGAIKTAAAPATMYWQWAVGQITASTTILAPKISRDARWMFTSTKVYKDGALLLDVQTSDPTMVILRQSFKNNGQTLMQWTTTVTIPPVPPGDVLFHGQGGTLVVDGFGSFPVGAPGNAFSPDGLSLVILSGSTLAFFTAADLTGLFGSLVTFVPDGSPADLLSPGTPGSTVDTLHVGSYSFTATGPTLVKEYPLTIAITRDAGDAGQTSITYLPEKAVPDDYLIQ